MADTLNPQKLLTQFLIDVGNEQTETLMVDGVPVMVTKAEALARQLYLMAMGGTQERRDDKGVVQERSFAPSIPAVKLIREWTEGRPSENKSAVEHKNKRPERFSKDAGSRLSRVLKTDVATVNNNPTRTAVALPQHAGLGNGRKDRPTIPKKA